MTTARIAAFSPGASPPPVRTPIRTLRRVPQRPQRRRDHGRCPVLREHAATRKTLAWLDVHTGLGPRGHGEKIYAGTNDAADVSRTREWWGDDVTSFLDGSSTSAPLTGINGIAARDECPGARFAGIALEYGTYPMEQVLQAFRAEHWLHNHPEAPETQRSAIKRHLRDMFYVDADDWKEMVYRQALDACNKAIGRLAQSPAHV